MSLKAQVVQGYPLLEILGGQGDQERNQGLNSREAVKELEERSQHQLLSEFSYAILMQEALLERYGERKWRVQGANIKWVEGTFLLMPTLTFFLGWRQYQETKEAGVLMQCGVCRLYS